MPKYFIWILECQNALSEFWNVKTPCPNLGTSKLLVPVKIRKVWVSLFHAFFWGVDGIVIGETNEFRGWYRSRFSCLCVWQWQDRDLPNIDRHLRWLRQFVGFLPYQKVSIYGSWSSSWDFPRTRSCVFTVAGVVCGISTVSGAAYLR